MASIEALLALALLLPQTPTGPRTQRTGAVIVSGVVSQGRLPLAELGLGDGGLGDPVVSPRQLGPGHHVTPGGVLVRAQREGVKLDFPSGVELMMMPDGVVHLRDGTSSARSLHTLEIWLADGSRVRAARSSGGRSAFRQVEVIEGSKSMLLWRRDLQLRLPATPQRPNGTCYLALGRGEVLYEAAAIGPLIILHRALCPRREAGAFPSSWLAIAGDVLAASLRRLPDHIPPQSIEFPQAPRAAANLAQSAAALFPPGRLERPRGAVGALVFPLVSDFRLTVEEQRDGPIWVGLYRGGAEIPVVEWRVQHRTTLHLLRPEGGRNGLPRYYLRGIDLTDDTSPLVPVPTTALSWKRARTTLRVLGARSPAVHAVHASSRDR